MYVVLCPRGLIPAADANFDLLILRRRIRSDRRRPTAVVGETTDARGCLNDPSDKCIIAETYQEWLHEKILENVDLYNYCLY